MKKLLKAIPVVLVLAMVVSMAASALSSTANLNSSQYYASSPKILGYYAKLSAYNSGNSVNTLNYLYIIGGKGQEIKESKVLTPGNNHSGPRQIDSTYGDTLQFNWYTYLQPTGNSTGLGGVGEATVYTNY